MWIINAILVHLLLIGSIFVIFFRSPVIRGLQPQKSVTELGLKPPARRVVIFVTDGLRAESFFKDDFANLPHLRKLLQHTGIVGISNTHVPTESRPGHIALLAGLYEDPSAVTRGWKENPIEFDTVFNRSAHTYAWGAHDILHIFLRLSGQNAKRQMIFDAYNDDLDFSGRNQTWRLDEWVFERVPKLLARKSALIKDSQQVIFFLHLLGLDTAGHVHKPNSKLFLENLHYTQRGIVQMYELFQQYFVDNETAYILTSDHGMTDAGAHGAGGIHETETPFFVWGAGILNKPLDKRQWTLLEQAQFAPLISALIGTATPMNNFGIIPTNMLNVSDEYLAHFVHSNALQLIAQFKALKGERDKGFFSAYLRTYAELDTKQLTDYEIDMKNYLTLALWDEAVNQSLHIMQHALEGIAYYHSYYKNVLLISTTVTFIASILYALQLLTENFTTKDIIKSKHKRSTIVCFMATIFISAICYLQNIDIYSAIYLLLPIPVIWLVLRQSIAKLVHQIPVLYLIVLFICAELLVCTFFTRTFISVCYIIYALTFCLRQMHLTACLSAKFFIWLSICCLLTIFPFLPSAVGKTNTPLLLLGMSLIGIRAFYVKIRLSLTEKIIYLIIICNYLFCIYQHSNQTAIYTLNYLINWLFIAYVFGSLLLQSKPDNELKQRIELIVLNLTILYTMLCTSYELIFVVLLTSELIISISSDCYNEQQFSPNVIARTNQIKKFQIALAVLLYTFFSFFGTGNMASISSFDTNIARCFLSKFAPFTIMILVILKLCIPILIIVTIIFGISFTARQYQSQIFLWLLIICDIMGLNFLYMVRNTGSWLEIGTSISHFVIMEVTTLVLVIITLIAQFFLNKNIKEVMFKIK